MTFTESALTMVVEIIKCFYAGGDYVDVKYDACYDKHSNFCAGNDISFL
jgi:hypothetical protein